jgi:hypothetical protein
MDHSRSNSVPLLNLDDDDIIDEAPVRKLNRSSFSMSSIHHIVTSPSSPRLSIIWHDKVPLNDTDDDTYEYDDYIDYDIDEDDMNDDYSTVSASSEEDEISIAIPGRKTMAVSQIQRQPTMPSLDLTSNILYEDIWTDSPVFHEYLQSLEAWLYHYLAWLEKVEQCRQLEIGKLASLISNSPIITEFFFL